MAKTTTGVVTATSLNVRPEANTSKPSVGTLARGAVVTILAREGVWYKIKSGELQGFAHGDYIKIKESAPVTGFLFEQDELRDASLAPSAGDRITVTSKHSAVQKLAANVWNSYGGLLALVSETLSVDAGAAVGIICVESSGKGMGPDGRMIIRFENHIFWKEWGKSNEATFNKHFRYNKSQTWKEHQFREKSTGTWAPFHGDQAAEWRVFEFARKLNQAAAMRSISMGLPQIMGFNSAAVGYDSVGEMFTAFAGDIRYQVLGLFDFIKGPGTTSPMLSALQLKNYDDFAARYNGPGQASVYGAKIAAHVDAFNAVKPGR